MIEKFRIGIALQPIATALFSASPFKEGKLSGYNSWRGNVWTDVDNNRCGNLPFVFDDSFSFESYADWALDVPMYFAYRNGEYLDATGQSFRDFINGDLAAAPGAALLHLPRPIPLLLFHVTSFLRTIKTKNPLPQLPPASCLSESMPPVRVILSNSAEC